MEEKPKKAAAYKCGTPKRLSKLRINMPMIYAKNAALGLVPPGISLLIEYLMREK